LHWCFLELLSSKLGSSKRGQGKRICVQSLIFGRKSWRLNANFFALASLPTFKLRAQELQERLMQILLPQSSSKKYLKTTKLQNPIQIQSRKKLKEKLEKLGNIPQVVVVFVCLPPPTRTRTQEYIYKIFGQDIRVSNTPFSKTKLGSPI
jgi:hypothetical protein